MSYKVDLKDLRILKELDQNPDITTSQLAKKTGVSQQVADYRLKNLIKNKIISSINAVVDQSKFGKTLFRTHIRFKSISDEKKKLFEENIFQEYNCFFMGAVGGRWDYYFDIFSETALKFKQILSQILQNFDKEIQEYETFIISRIHIYNYKYILDSEPLEILFGETKFKEEIDEIDDKILKIIKTDSRTSFIQIGSQVGLTRNAVKGRIQKLHERKIITSNRIFLHSKLLNQESYKLLLKLKKDLVQEQKLLQFAKQNKNIIYSLELMGKYDLDLEIEIDNREKLQELIIELRNKFPIISDYEIMPLFYDAGSNFY